MMNESNATQVYSYCKYWIPHSHAERTIQMAALFIIGGFGVICNVFTIVLAAKYTVRRNLHFLIINMAVSDATVIVNCLLQGTTTLLHYKLWNNDFAGSFACKAIPFMYSVVLLTSLSTLTIISIERFRITRRRTVQISHPLSAKHRVCVVACSWLMSSALSLYIPILYHIDKQYNSCGISLFYYSIISFIKTIVHVIMFSFMLIINILTLRRLSSRQAIEDSLSEEQRKLRRQRMGSAVKMVLYSIILYCCCFFPAIIYDLQNSINLLIPSWASFLSYGCIDVSSLLFMIEFFLPIVNSSLSPCIYFVCLPDFRDAAKTFLWQSKVETISGSLSVETT